MKKSDENSISTSELGDVLKEYFGIYVKYVSEDRAIPDIRDGLKPVHRRLIYAAWNMGARFPNKMMKSAKPVATCMGNYHPHGDSSIYDSLVRMTQDFSMRIPLFDAQGNFGSIDGDPAAAQRYTETRLNKIAQDLFCNNLNKEVVGFIPSYDESTIEPSVLPAELPHILLNCNSGIAVGIATDIISCAPRELIDCLIGEIDEKLITNSIDKAPRQFRGLDLPTSGMIELDKSQLTKLWKQGTSSWNIRGESSFEIDEGISSKKIIITSLPYQQQKDKLLTDIAKLLMEKKEDGSFSLEGIVDMRDESTKKDGIRIVFVLSPGADIEITLNSLYSKTKLQKTLNTNIVALVDGKPKYVGVREILLKWMEFRKECVVNILKKEKLEKETRSEIVGGFLIVHKSIDKVIKIIRNSENVKEELMSKLKLTKNQATSIVEMRLGNLRKIDQNKLKEESEELKSRILEIEKTLKNPKKIDVLIRDRLIWWRENTDKRRTKIVKSFGEVIAVENVIEQDFSVSIKNNKIKIKDTKGKSAKINSSSSVQITTCDTLYIFTDKSRVFEKSSSELSETKNGNSLFPGLESDEKIVGLLSINMKVKSKSTIVMIRSNGDVKRMDLEGLTKKRGLLEGDICCRCDQDDSKLINVILVDEKVDLIMFTKNGAYRRISIDTFRPLPTRASGGNKCFTLTNNDNVIGVDSIKENDYVVSISELGFCAKFKENSLPFKKGRVGKGIKLASSDTKSGKIIYGGILGGEETLSLSLNGNKSLKATLGDLKEVNRGSRGYTLSSAPEDVKIEAVSKI